MFAESETPVASIQPKFLPLVPRGQVKQLWPPPRAKRQRRGDVHPGWEVLLLRAYSPEVEHDSGPETDSGAGLDSDNCFDEDARFCEEFGALEDGSMAALENDGGDGSGIAPSLEEQALVPHADYGDVEGGVHHGEGERHPQEQAHISGDLGSAAAPAGGGSSTCS